LMVENFYQPNDVTPGGDTIGSATYNWTVPQLWAQIQVDANYTDRKKAVEEYNASNRWTKKGIAITASKWNLKSNQYEFSARLSAYADGTVYVATGGVEIGQGLNTKVSLCVAQTLGIPFESVLTEGGDTNICPNSAITGGSGSSESCCNAAIQAAETLKSRLSSFLDGGKTWVEAVGLAKTAGVSLMADGWFNGIAFEPKKNIYAVYGTAITEVLLDVLTGETRLERVDLMMDLGNQLDAAIDIGQVQGGYVQTLGYLFSEELKWDAAGKQLHLGTWEYKVPTAYDIPVEFNVGLLKNSPNPHAIAKNSKAVAEPAMSLISSPYLAVKNAIYAARSEMGSGDDFFMLPAPISPEVIRAAINVPKDQMKLP